LALVSQKCQYGLRAIFELAKRQEQGPAKIAAIAEAQAIPPRFLEVILSELKQGGFVESRRGREGGYLLAREPGQITVGEVIGFIGGPIGPVEPAPGRPEDPACVFTRMWEKVRSAISGVCDNITFQDLLEEEAKLKGTYVASYSI